MTQSDSLRLHLFKNQIKNNDLDYLEGLNDEELLKLLDSTVVANSPDSRSIRYAFLFNLLFYHRKSEKEKFINQIEKLKRLESSLTKTEKVIMKFGLIHGFSSSNYRKELFRYINNPIGFDIKSERKKSISSVKFKEIFSFAYNIIKRGMNNEQFPRF